MDSDEIRRYSAQRFQGIRSHFGLARQSADEEAIHQMRVEIKRLKALFQLLQELSADFRAKQSLMPVRPLYKSAGKIRDLQVQAGLARLWMEDSGNKGLLDGYCQHLADLERQAQAGFCEECQIFDTTALEAMEESVGRAVSSLPANQVHRQAESHLERLQRELLQRGQASKPEDDLHPLRILAKRTRHTAELLKMRLSSPGPPAEAADAVRDIEQALGQWHDQEVALVFAGTFQEQSGASPACQEYMQFLKIKKRQLRESFLEALPKLSELLGHRT